MRLKSIKLAGFKSFVDPTTVPFATNMTAIVGPNGCGKSNIIDAVRWVMGESSAKNLRGESMTDVIFNGSTGRQPVGQASIELLFDNTEGRLTGEYAAFSEISIRRKVTREGISQYYLNGTKCRRRDVTDIFLGTGMGPRSYAIIEQGMISKLIESKPEDLRVYLEEAAGISKYKERRRETENRMRRTQDNLDRLSDIREELGKQLQNLKRQANAAEKYAEYKQEQRLNSAKLNAIYWQRLTSEYDSKQQLIREHELKIEDSVLAKNSNENKVDTLKTLIEEAQVNFNGIQSKYYQSGTEIATLEQKLHYQKTRLQDQKHTLVQLNQEVEDIELNLNEQSERSAQITFELDDILLEIEEVTEVAESLALELEASSIRLDDWQIKWEEFNQQTASARQSAEIAQNKIQNNESRLREFSLRQEKLFSEKIDLQNQINETDLSLLKEELEIITAQLIEFDAKSETLQPQIEQKRLELDSLKAQKDILFKELSADQAVLASLSALQEEGLSQGEDNFSLLANEFGKSNLERLIDLIEVEPNWELAVEHVLANWLDALVYKGQKDLVGDTEINNKLFKAKASISMLFDSSNNTINNSTALTNRLSSVIKGVFPNQIDVDSIYIADNLTQALSIRETLEEHESVITSDGCWFGKNWFRYFNTEKQGDSALLRAKKIQSLKESCKGKEQLLANLEQQIELYNFQIQSFKEEFDTVKNTKLSIDSDFRKLEQQLSSNQAKLDQLKLRLDRVLEELSEIDLQKEESALSLEEYRANWNELLTVLEAYSERKELLREEKDQLQTKYEQLKNSAHESRNIVHQKQLFKQQKDSEKLLLTQTLQRLSIELAARREKIEALSSGDESNEELIEELSLQLEGLLDTRVATEEKLTKARKVVEDLSLSLREEEMKRNDFEAHISSARDALTKLRMDAQALYLNKRNILEKIEQDDFEVENLIKLLDSVDTEPSLKETLSQLEVKIARLGSINLAAIEEYQVQSERKAHLDEQNEDLMDALDTLMSAIKKIDKETRTRFKETFDQVNEGLQKLFPKIFGGGNAYLELTDDNLLETGVQIIARPPGKKNATIHLLSGGEKSLTAIALIFAIFELNPAPFCMLDEVDAPLDDANVGRFANIVKEMSSQVQFIYISHNKVSMERADQLMGVTMHEPGVSRLVSVDIEQAAAMVESA